MDINMDINMSEQIVHEHKQIATTAFYYDENHTLRISMVCRTCGTRFDVSATAYDISRLIAEASK